MHEWEKDLIEKSLKTNFDVDVKLGNRFLIAHKLPSWTYGIDYVSEVFGEAARLGLFLHLVDTDEWVVEGSGALASILIKSGAKGVEIRSEGGAKRRLKGKKVELPCALSYCLVRVGGHVGFAKRVNNLYKIKDLAKLDFKMLRETSVDSLLEKNGQLMENVVGEAESFIKKTSKIYPQKKMPVAYSGGADSTALLVLAVEALGSDKVVAVYTDTRLEIPENIDYVKQITDKLGVELIALKSPYDPYIEIKSRGLMSVKNRWCTKLLKLEALRIFYRENGYKVYLDGARSYESALRERTPRLSENPYIKNVKRALPIKDWPRFMVQLFLISRKIPINPLYEKGLTRIGCIVCPAMMPYELKISYDSYREYHLKILEASRLNEKEYLTMAWSAKH